MIKDEEGAVMAVRHCSTHTQSLLIYVTQNGFIHGHDLRMRKEIWKLQMCPDLGYITAMTHSGTVDAPNCLIVGTNRGFIALWDLRFLLLVKIWRHSDLSAIHSIHISERKTGSDRPPTIFVATGDNEVSEWDVSSGRRRSLMRTVASHGYDERDPPRLESIELPLSLALQNGQNYSHVKHGVGTWRHGHFALPFKQKKNLLEENLKTLSAETAVRAMHFPNNRLLITGGGDRKIRLWDLQGTREGKSKSCTLVGSEFGNERMVEEYAYRDEREDSKTIVCFDKPLNVDFEGNPDSVVISERRGARPPIPHHADCILDIKMAKLPLHMMLSAGRDGVVKVWR